MMTWGQLRLLLTGSEVSEDQIDGWLNTRYEKILSKTDWKGIEGNAIIQTQAAYQSAADSVTFTVGSATVAGSGTAWTSAITGQKIYRPGDTVTYTATYNGAAALTLDRPYEGNGSAAPGTVFAAAPYVFMQNIYRLPADCETVTDIMNPGDGLPMEGMTKAELDAAAGERTHIDNPAIYAIYADTPEISPPVLHQVEFYPPPRYARGFPLIYRRTATGFDGVSTNLAPLPFVTSDALLSGVRADIATHLKELGQAMKYESDFDKAIADMLRVEHQQRRAKPKLQMAPRFTRHRWARAQRGFNNNWGPGQGGPN